MKHLEVFLHGLVMLLSLFCAPQVSSQAASMSANWNWRGQRFGSSSDLAVYGAINQFDTAYYPGTVSQGQGFFYNDSFYLFGGSSNFMWQYRTNDNLWGWISGTQYLCTGTCIGGVCTQYGTKRVTSNSSVPSARSSHQGWLANNTVYIFGGSDCNAGAERDDLWSFNLSSSLWTWIAGTSTIKFAGNFTKDIYASPSARFGTSGVVVNSNLYLFGGQMYTGMMSDLWMFNTVTFIWSYLKGPSIPNQGMIFSTGGNPSNRPDGLTLAQMWFSGTSNRFYVFGGDKVGGILSSTWCYFDLNSLTWRVEDFSYTATTWRYGPIGQFGASYFPIPRDSASTWTYYAPQGTFLMMYGGYGSLETNNVWAYWEENKVWAWVAGSSGLDTGSGFSSTSNGAQYQFPQATLGQIGQQQVSLTSWYYFASDNNIWSLSLNFSRCLLGSFSANSSGYTCQYCSAGTFSNQRNFTACLQCASGSYTSSAAQSSCIVCPAGTYTPDSLTPCLNCPTGRISSSGVSVCQSCEPGKYSNNNITSTTCFDCTAGYFSLMHESDSCNLCPSGRFSSTQSSFCQTCGLNAITASVVSISQQDCVCPEGYYGRGNESCNLCSASLGTLCPYNSSVPYVKAGWFRSLLGNMTQVTACLPAESCVEAGYGSTVCSSGYVGQGCLSCAAEFYRFGIKCLPCMMKGGRWAIIVLLFLGSVYACWRLTRAESRIPLTVKITFSWLQVLSLFSLVSSNWPKSLSGLFDASSVLNGEIQLFGFNCDQFTFWDVWVVKIFVPIIMVSLICLFNIIEALKQHNHVRSHHYLWKLLLSKFPSIIYSLSLVSTLIYNAIFQLFYCVQVHDGWWVLASDPSVKCFDSTWYKYLVLDILAIVGYVIALPAFSLFYILSNVKNPSKAENLKMITSPYRSGLEYWEIVKLCYKMVFIMLRNAGGIESSVREFILVVILITQLYIDVKVNPHKSTAANDTSNT
jgi:hypothetical protein